VCMVVVPDGLLGEVADKRKCARSSLTCQQAPRLTAQPTGNRHEPVIRAIIAKMPSHARGRRAVARSVTPPRGHQEMQPLLTPSTRLAYPQVVSRADHLRDHLRHRHRTPRCFDSAGHLMGPKWGQTCGPAAPTRPIDGLWPGLSS
jgi:hypothetical protein